MKETLSNKKEALKIAKVKECDYITQLDKVEKEVKSLQRKQSQRPQSHSSRGSSSNSNLICYLCSKTWHVRARKYHFNGHRKMRGSRNRKSPPKIKKTWVRKDQVHLTKNKDKEKVWKKSKGKIKTPYLERNKERNYNDLLIDTVQIRKEWTDIFNVGFAFFF